MDFPPSFNFLSLQEHLHNAWLLLWPLLFLGEEEESALSSKSKSIEDDDDDDDEGEGKGDDLFLFFLLLELLLPCLVSH